MPRILITGMSGAGKSTLLEELSRRGHATIDTDLGTWKTAAGTWDETQMSDALATHDALIVGGAAENQRRFYDRFDHVVLLSAPVEVLIDRVVHRTNNPYGKTPEQQAAIRRYVRDIEPLLRRGATIELDGRRPVTALADAIEELP